MNIKDTWFKILILILLAILVWQVSVFLNRMAWSSAYTARAECLEKIYARGNIDPFDTKKNCFDIIYEFNK
jgi:hypothetical protein